MDKTLATILESPKLGQYFDEIQRVLSVEVEKRKEFYQDVTEHQKAEFINGEIILHSPVKLRHTNVGRRLVQLLAAFVQKHDLGLVGYEKMLVSFSRNDYEPDICFFVKAKSEHFRDEQMTFPPPDFIIEILSPSTAELDRGIKFIDYAAHGVREYWIVDPETELLEQYILLNDNYDLKFKGGSGEVVSLAISDLTLPVRALFDDEVMWQTLQSIMI